MQISRSETHSQDKLKRKKRLKRRIIVNFTLLGLIIILLGGWFAVSKADQWKDWFSFSGGDTKEQAIVSDGEDPASEEQSTGKVDLPDEDQGTDKDGGAVDLPKEDEGAGNVPVTETDGDDRVSLSFVGDVLVADYVSAITAKEGYDFLYKQALLYLSEPDITAGNLEFPITNGGTPVTGTPYVFKGSPDVLPSMRDAGFDVMSLANNHALDQGVEGMLDTIKYLDEAGISHMGAGNNAEEAYAPVIKEVRGIKIAYVGISRVIPFNSWKADKNTPGLAESYDINRATAAIAKAKEQADIVIVMVHWGKERVDQPDAIQKDYGKQYIDAGADLVIGSHPHVLQGFEMYKGKWIAYSLGNFIFSSYPKGTGGETGVLDASCTKNGDCELTFHPMFTNQAQPTPLEGDAAKALLDRLSSISFGVKLEHDGRLISN